jgi:hypothetical protein
MAADYRTAIDALRSDWKRPLAAGLALSVCMVLVKCAIGFIVATGLGYQGGFVEVAARQGLQLFVLYFSPTPGGSGIAEASVPVFMSGVVPEDRWMEFALLWRAMTSYAGVAIGALAAAIAFASERPRSVATVADPAA